MNAAPNVWEQVDRNLAQCQILIDAMPKQTIAESLREAMNALYAFAGLDAAFPEQPEHLGSDVDEYDPEERDEFGRNAEERAADRLQDWEDSREYNSR